MQDKLFLIDGHALVFKMYYAFIRKPMINSKGADMSILYGFTKAILELIEKEEPTHLAVAFDPPGGSFRNGMYPEYKGTRPPTPQLVIDALDPLKEILRNMNIPVLMLSGFEADDMLGTVAKSAEKEGFTVYIVTPDKDCGQLVSDHILQYRQGKNGAAAEILGKEEICARYGISDPMQVIDMLAICGDSADNVPGVKGVGEVGAGKLISKWGSLENIYAHLDELPARQKEMFEAASDHIALSKDLVTIRTDIPFSCSFDDMKLDMDFNPGIADLFEKYEFNSLSRYIAHVGKPSSDEPVSPEGVFTKSCTSDVCDAAMASGSMSVAEGNGIIAAAARGADGSIIAAAGSATDFSRAFALKGIDVYGFGLKDLFRRLGKEGVAIGGRLMDIALMHYLTDPEKSHKEDILTRSYLGRTLAELPSAGAPSLFGDEPSENVSDGRDELVSNAADFLELGGKVLSHLKSLSLDGLFFKMEEPLEKVLAKMEDAGVRIDLSQLSVFADGLRKEISDREKTVRDMTGEPQLNVSSPKQIGEVLFDKLKLDPKAKKSSKGQYSTDEATLLQLADRSPVIDEILEFRAAKKLLSTYIEPFPGFVSPSDGKIHTTFNQALTATGRLSSSNPNLQNIPVRTERGREIRKAFVPSFPGGCIMSADYSQIELRIMAHLSCDAHMTEAFRSGEDVHKATAAKIYGIPAAEVTADMRRVAKTANFGIMYGISAFGLAQRLRIGRKEAQKIIDDYFEGFPAIKAFIADTIGFAKGNGYVETIFGRRRYLPDITSSNATVRALAERNAVNAPIQGTAADIIKMAMIAVDREMSAAGMESRMVLQIHDELLFDVAPGEEDALRGTVVSCMENVIPLSVPLTVDCNIGKNWLEAH